MHGSSKLRRDLAIERGGAIPPFAGAEALKPTIRAKPQRLVRRYWHNSKLVIELCRPADMAVLFAMLLAAFLAANLHRIPDGLEAFLLTRVTAKNILFLAGFAVVWPLIFSACGLYNNNQIATPRNETLRVLGACTLVSVTTIPVVLAGISGAFRAYTVLLFWLFAVAGVLGVRHLIRFAVGASRASTPRQILIVGRGPRAHRLYQQLTAEPQSGCAVVGFVDSSVCDARAEVDRLTLGSLEELEAILMHRVVDEVLIALPIRSCYQEIQDAIRVCERVGVEARYLADIFHCSLARQAYDDSDGRPVVTLKVVQDDLRLLLKRGLDLVGAAVGLVVLAPVFAAIAILIKATSPGPVFFVQRRYGYNKRVFRMYKFRTMVANAESLQVDVEHLNEAEGPIFKIRRDPRLTPIGKFLRRTSLDELPQLYNVLRGEMSLVGPRPMSLRDVQRFSEAWLMRRFSVTPGVTGLWQVSGRSDLSFGDWIALDLQYIDEWSLGLDLRILARTLPAVVRGTGAE